jgi:hypothetical protein
MAPSHRITNISLSVTGRVMVVDDWPGRGRVSMLKALQFTRSVQCEFSVQKKRHRNPSHAKHNS